MHFLNRITLQTPESVELEFTLAGIGNRALALGLDYTFLALLLTGFIVILSLVVEPLSDLLAIFNLGSSDLELWIVAIALLIVFATYVGYFVFFEAFWQGQTPGKRLAHIRVIRDDGRPIHIPQATLRAIVRPIDDLFFVGCFLIVLNKREKRLGDWLAGTLVIQEERGAKAQNLIVAPQAPAIAQQLLAITDISALTPDDFAILRNYLQRRQELTLQAQEQLSQQLAEQLQAMLKLEQRPTDVSAALFLEAAYLAYQQQSHS
jgi:uncharacterized RDD family membrane protein YckC